MRNNITAGGTAIVATMTWSGQDYDIIRFGCRLRIVGRRNDRSLDAKGYLNVQEVRDRYPEARVQVS